MTHGGANCLNVGAVGVKSGYTQEDGRCLVVLARRGDTHVLLIMLNDPERWWTAASNLDTAFAQAFAKRYLHAPVDKIVGGGNTATMKGSNAKLAIAIQKAKEGHLIQVPSFMSDWRA